MAQRREKGSGSISQRKDGTWTARTDIGYNENGKRIVKAFYGKTKGEVRKKLQEFQAERIKGEYQQVVKRSVQGYMTDWLNEVKYNELKPSAFDRLEQTCKYQVFPFIGSLQMGMVTADDVQSVINQLTDKGYSYSTIKKAYNAINACFTFAYEREAIRKNPCIRISLPKKAEREKSDIVYFNDDERRALEQAALQQHKNGAYKSPNGWYIILLLNTGLRIGELLALQWCNVDFDNKQIKVTGNLKQVKARGESPTNYITVEQTTKTKSGHRIVPLTNRAVEALRYLEEHKHSDKYVAATKNGKPISARNIDRTFRQTLTAAGIDKKCGVHSLRHTFASMLFKKGADPKTVSEILGHSDVNITYNIYIHLIQEQKAKVIDLLNE